VFSLLLTMSGLMIHKSSNGSIATQSSHALHQHKHSPDQEKCLWRRSNSVIQPIAECTTLSTTTNTCALEHARKKSFQCYTLNVILLTLHALGHSVDYQCHFPCCSILECARAADTLKAKVMLNLNCISSFSV
jgi:hypothetical protein